MTIRSTGQSRGIKAKGREAENAVVEYLMDRGCDAERRRQTGIGDCGDIGGVPGWVIEVKAEKRINLSGYLAELAAEVEAADIKFRRSHQGVVIVKKRGTLDASQWYAVMPFGKFMDLAG